MESNNSPVIFVVEDNLIYQHLIAKKLEKLTRSIYFYISGEECLEDLGYEPSIIILDFNLDGSMNGLDTLKQIRTIKPAVHVIVFSNEPDLHTRENMIRYGSFDFLEKCDQSFSTLEQMVSRFLKIPSCV